MNLEQRLTRAVEVGVKRALIARGVRRGLLHWRALQIARRTVRTGPWSAAVKAVALAALDEDEELRALLFAYVERHDPETWRLRQLALRKRWERKVMARGLPL